MSDYTNRKAPRPTRFTFVGHRFDPRRTRATFYYRDNQGHHYAEKITFDCPEPAQVNRKLLARALDFALFAIGLDYFAAHPTDLVASKQPISPRLAALIAPALNSAAQRDLSANALAAQFTPSDPRPSLPYQGSGNLVLIDPVDTSLELAAELTAAHLPFRPLCITISPVCPPALNNLDKPLTLIHRPRPAIDARRPQPLADISLALIQVIFYNFNRLYLGCPVDAQLIDFIHREISPDLELIWKN